MQTLIRKFYILDRTIYTAVIQDSDVAACIQAIRDLGLLANFLSDNSLANGDYLVEAVRVKCDDNGLFCVFEIWGDIDEIVFLHGAYLTLERAEEMARKAADDEYEAILVIEASLSAFRKQRLFMGDNVELHRRNAVRHVPYTEKVLRRLSSTEHKQPTMHPPCDVVG